MIELTKYVACICEGGAENAIISLLLEQNKLIFTRQILLDGEIIKTRKAKDFEQRYLRKGFSEKVTVLRILDSHRESFALSKAYSYKVNVINVITAPEIEMLIILSERKYEDFKSKGIKPSTYCKTVLGFSNVKSPEFVLNYFGQIEKLIFAIKEYKRISKSQKNEITLADLLKP